MTATSTNAQSENTAATTTTMTTTVSSPPLSPPHSQPPPPATTSTVAGTTAAASISTAASATKEVNSQRSGPSSPSQGSGGQAPLEVSSTNIRPSAPSAPAMKDRSVSASTDRSRPGNVNHHMSISPSHRLGSRSPVSIPSSPTSIHSSSSAIFERDIELPPFSTLPHPHQGHPMNPHRTPRSKTTETLETSVPSVLDSAATLLATSDVNSELDVAVEAPLPLLAASTASLTARAMSAAGGILGSTSPVNRGSRSPSPTTSMASRQYRTSMLLNLPSPVQGSVTLPGASSPTSSGGRSPPTGSPNNVPPPLTSTTTATVVNLGEAALPLPGGFTQPTTATTATAISPRPSSEGETEYESALSNSNSDAGDHDVDDGGATEEGQMASPTTTTRERPPMTLPSPTTPTANLTLQSHPPRSTVTNQVSSPMSSTGFSHPPSPSSHHGSGSGSMSLAGGGGSNVGGGAQKRLSFLAYADVRAGAPVSTRPLSVLTYSSPSPPAAMSSPGSPGSGSGSVAGAGGSMTQGAPNGMTAALYQEEPPHLPAVEGALEGVGVLEPSNGSGSSASVLGMSFGGYGYGGHGGYGYGSRSASAATSARNSLVLDSLPGVLGAAGVGQSASGSGPQSHTHTHTNSQGHTHVQGHGHTHAPSMAVGARPHSVYAHGAAADVKEPGSALEDDDGEFSGVGAGADVFGFVSVPPGPPGLFPAVNSSSGSGEEATSGVGSNSPTAATLPVPMVRAEWEREGLGRGLEERLEAVLVAGKDAATNLAGGVAAGKEAAKA